MAQIVRTEVRRRGFFGKIFKWMFIAFNLVMAVLFAITLLGINNGIQSIDSGVAGFGYTAGALAGLGMFLFFWVAGDIILGLMVMFTRGKRTTIEETIA